MASKRPRAYSTLLGAHVRRGGNSVSPLRQGFSAHGTAGWHQQGSRGIASVLAVIGSGRQGSSRGACESQLLLSLC